MPIKTELIWDGKYDADGKRVAPLRVALPFQTVETVNESAQDRQLNLFQSASKAQAWRNHLIWGDKKYVLPSLLAEFAGKVDLIYIDPPFDTGADFSFTAAVPETDDEDAESVAFTKQPSIIEQKAYRDTWGRGLDSYLHWFHETAIGLYELLAETGSFFVHLDYHVSHYVKCILDEIYGSNNFQNEIIWKRSHAQNNTKGFGPNHDVIYWFTKTNNYTWNQIYQKYEKSYEDKHYRHVDANGRRYKHENPSGAGTRQGVTGKPWRGIDPTKKGRHWAYTPDQLEELDTKGLIYWPEKRGAWPYIKTYLDEMKGMPAQDSWSDIDPINMVAIERTNYPTQKPEALLERVIRAASNENDLVLDCFAGSGTTAAVAEKLNRRWIACDLGRFAIHTTRKRLLNIPDVRPFVVQNLGKYERQMWQVGAFADSGPAKVEEATRRHRAYIDFILTLYHASPLNGYTWLHGVKAGRMVHVGGVDAPVSVGDVQQIAIEFKRAMGTGKDAPTTNGVDVLGWEFAFELNEVAKQQAAAANIQMQFKRIPRDVMDKRAVEQGDIQFFELAALAVDVSVKGREATLTLTDFVIPPDDVPAEVMGAVRHWSQWIDYWAVDWDHKGDAFHNQWQSFRTRKDGKLALSATHRYEEPGEYRAVVKVIDILGNDTTKTVKAKVK
ncbi:MAG TPA: site-specific DNA-methyltransferase [Isosphaeraceae bacterium]|nr:site-specific DNA-methyltransferase [Isosphaeraceae bacterium]